MSYFSTPRANYPWPRHSGSTRSVYHRNQRPIDRYSLRPVDRYGQGPADRYSQRPDYGLRQRPDYSFRQRPHHDLVDLDDSDPDLTQSSEDVLNSHSSYHQTSSSPILSSSERQPIDPDGQPTASSPPQTTQDNLLPDASSPAQNSQSQLIETSKALAENFEIRLDKIVHSLRKGINFSRKREQGTTLLAQQNFNEGLEDLETLGLETSKLCESSIKNAEFTSSLIYDLSVSKVTITSLQKDLATSEECSRLLKEENTRLQNEVEVMLQARSYLTQHASSLEEQLGSSRTVMARLNSDLDASLAESASLTKKLVASELKPRPSQCGSHQEVISRLQLDLKESTEERDSLTKRLSELNLRLLSNHISVPPILISNSTQTISTQAQNVSIQTDSTQEDLDLMSSRMDSLESSTSQFLNTIKKEFNQLVTTIQNKGPSLQPSSSSQHQQSQKPHHLQVLVKPNSSAKNNLPAFRSTTKSTLNNLKSEHFKIIKTTDLKDGTIAISCSKQSDPEKLNLLLSGSKTLQETANLSIKSPKTVKLIIKELPLDTPTELILSTLHSLGSLSSSTGNKFLYKQSKACSQVIIVEEDIAKSIMKLAKPTILIGNSSFPVAFYIHYFRCANCQEFGHLVKNCPNSTHICASCGRDNHSTENCYHKDDPSYHFCANCDYHNSLNPKYQLNPYHQASSKSCTCFKLYVKEQTEQCFASLFKYNNHPLSQPPFPPVRESL